MGFRRETIERAPAARTVPAVRTGSCLGFFRGLLLALPLALALWASLLLGLLPRL